MRNKTANHNYELDHFDLEIIAILQKNNKTPQRLIGEAVNLSAAAVNRRIKAMEENNIIQFNIAIVDTHVTGEKLTLLVEVELHDEGNGQHERIKNLFYSDTEIQQCYYVTGEADFIMVIVTADMQAYEKLTKRLFFENENVKRFRTFVSLEKVKSCLMIPIPG